jgi:glutaminase-like protein
LSASIKILFALLLFSANCRQPARAFAGPPAGRENLSGLTILNERSADALFSGIASHREIPFAFPEGCHAKAQKIAVLLEAKGIIGAKVFVEGKIFQGASPWHQGEFWLFHVAPVILVEHEGEARPYVIDPYLADRLLSYDEWIGLIRLDPRSSLTAEYFTTRFVYSPDQKDSNPTQYDPALIKDMDSVLDQLSRRLHPGENAIAEVLSSPAFARP